MKQSEGNYNYKVVSMWRGNVACEVTSQFYSGIAGTLNYHNYHSY